LGIPQNAVSLITVTSAPVFITALTSLPLVTTGIFNVTALTLLIIISASQNLDSKLSEGELTKDLFSSIN
jgi:hypothetical protein